MCWLTIVVLRLRTLLQRSQVERELQDEIQFHVDEQIVEYRAAGMAPDEARRRALREIGGATRVREECRDARVVSFLETTFLDLRYAVRSLCQNPGFTAVVVVSLALGIGANTVVFSVVNAILLRSLPYEDPEGIVLIQTTDANTGRLRGRPAADYQAFEEENPVFERMAYWGNADFTVKNDGVAQRIEGQRVSVSLFSVLGVRPILGRNFLPEDENGAAAPAVILSYRLWERLFEKILA
jgi:putative ABC transport system permease protein